MIYALGRDGGIAMDGLATLTILPPRPEERRALWQGWTRSEELADRLGRFAALDGTTINSIGRAARLAAEREGGGTCPLSFHPRTRGLRRAEPAAARPAGSSARSAATCWSCLP